MIETAVAGSTTIELAENPPIKVMIGLPNTGTFHAQVVIAILKMLQETKGYDVSMDFTAAAPIDNCRNSIVNSFLEKDADYLLFIDSDNPPERNPLDLVELDLDIIVFPTLIFHSKISQRSTGKIPLCWNVFTWDEEMDRWKDYRNYKGLQEVDAGGTGCMLIARRVLEKVRPAFLREWKEDGTAGKGSDLLFCKKAKDAGFRVWAHFDYFCSHIKYVNLLDMYKMIDWRNITHALKPNINTPSYWDGQWAKRPERILPVYQPIMDLVETRLDGAEKIRVLDFGCGRGDLLAGLSQLDGVCAEGMDYSPKAVEVCQARGLTASLGDRPTKGWDVIIATEVLEHVDDDDQLIKSMLECADTVIYSVPWDCLPPGLEPEHRRVYTKDYVMQITPQLIKIHELDDYLIVEAGK